MKKSDRLKTKKKREYRQKTPVALSCYPWQKDAVIAMCAEKQVSE